MAHVSEIRRFALAILAIGAIGFAKAETPADETLTRQKAALDVIRDFADNFCKTVPLTGKSDSVEASGEAKAKLSNLLKKLADLGIEGAVKYKSEEWQGPLRESLSGILKENQNCRLEIWKDLQSKLIRTSAALKKPELVQLLQSSDGKNMRLEAIIQNESDRDFFVTRFVVGKGYDFSEYSRILSCCLYCMEQKTYSFDRLVALNTDAGASKEAIVGFKDKDEPKFVYPARYYFQDGCISPLSYTLDADVAFRVSKGAFTGVRILLPESAKKSDKTNAQFSKLDRKIAALEPNAFCVEFTIKDEVDTLRSCKSLERRSKQP